MFLSLRLSHWHSHPSWDELSWWQGLQYLIVSCRSTISTDTLMVIYWWSMKAMLVNCAVHMIERSCLLEPKSHFSNEEVTKYFINFSGIFCITWIIICPVVHNVFYHKTTPHCKSWEHIEAQLPYDSMGLHQYRFSHSSMTIPFGKLYAQVVVVILFPTEYKQWRTEYVSNIITTRKP